MLIDISAQVEYAGLQAEQVRNVTAFRGKGLDGLAVEGIADGGVDAIQRLGLGADIDGLRRLDHTELKVNGGGLVDQQLRLFGGVRESGRRDRNRVSAGRQLRELVEP